MAVSRLTRSLLRQHQFPGYHQTTANIEAPYVKVHSPSCAENYTRCRKGPRLSPKGPLSTKRRRKAPCPKFSHVLPTFSRATTQSAPNNRKPPDLNKRELQSAKSQLKHRLLPLHSPHAHDTNPQGSPPYSAQFPNSRLMFLTTTSPPSLSIITTTHAASSLVLPVTRLKTPLNYAQLQLWNRVSALRIRQTAVGPRHNSPKRRGKLRIYATTQ
jgi:hypothetical protein